MKTLNKKQKEAECKRQINEQIKAIKTDMQKKLSKALVSGSVPDYFYEQGNYLLTKAIIDSFCRERPYSPVSTYKKDVENIHNFI